MFGYDTVKEETVSFTATSGLHGHDISRIFYNPSEKCLAVCYKNGGIDLMASDGKVKYVSDIADSQLSDTSRSMTPHSEARRCFWLLTSE